LAETHLERLRFWDFEAARDDVKTAAEGTSVMEV
jgi:hypothetical protein